MNGLQRAFLQGKTNLERKQKLGKSRNPEKVNGTSENLIPKKNTRLQAPKELSAQILQKIQKNYDFLVYFLVVLCYLIYW